MSRGGDKSTAESPWEHGAWHGGCSCLLSGGDGTPGGVCALRGTAVLGVRESLPRASLFRAASEATGTPTQP